MMAHSGHTGLRPFWSGPLHAALLLPSASRARTGEPRVGLFDTSVQTARNGQATSASECYEGGMTRVVMCWHAHGRSCARGLSADRFVRVRQRLRAPGAQGPWLPR
eukprot:7381836-Prymnesium_polylepis.1